MSNTQRISAVLLALLLAIASPVAAPALVSPAPPPLVDTGLVVRYYVDEAASGQTPTEVLDTSGVGTAFNLAITYVDATSPVYTEVSGNRGLERINLTRDGAKAQGSIHNTSDKVRDNLHGAQKVTLEMVLDVTDADISEGFTFQIERNGGSRIGMRVRGSASSSPGTWRVYFNGALAQVYSAADFGLSAGRIVVHMVVDTIQATEADRIKVYKNGSFVAADSTGTMPAQNATLDFGGTNTRMNMLNNQFATSSARPMQGVIYYGAFYAHAFTSSEVTTNYDILTADDDTPSAGARRRGYVIE